MSGELTHSPAKIVQQMLVDLGLATLPSAGGSWPIYATHEPDEPDSVITVYDTQGVLDGRYHTSGEVIEHYGVQVRVRDATAPDGWTKANAIAVAITESVYQEVVTIDSNVYLVHAMSRMSSVLPLGKDVPTGRRYLFTINATATIQQTS